MQKLSIRQAAKAVGVSRSTLTRAIQLGRMSAHRRAEGEGYWVEPSELFRVFEPRAACPPDAEHPVEDQDAQGVDELDAQPGQGPTVLHIRLARMEERVKALEAVLEVERRRADEDRRRAEAQADELRRERDRWAGVAETSQRQLTDLTAKRKGFAGWFRRSV